MDSGLMDARGHIKKNSKLVLVVTEDGALTAEGTPPDSRNDNTAPHAKHEKIGKQCCASASRSGLICN